MNVVFDTNRRISSSKQEYEIDGVCRIRWIGIKGPFEIPEAAPVSIVSAMVNAGNESFSEIVRHEQGNTAAAAMDQRRHHALKQILSRCQICQGVVNKDRVEQSVQSKRA